MRPLATKISMKLKYILSLLALVPMLIGLVPVSAGQITPEGQKLAAFLDSMNVEKLWLAGAQVDWRTGLPNGKVYQNPKTHTHCSAFAAEAAERLGIYLLRPPEHSAVLLANAQQEWLCTRGTNLDWHPVTSPLKAQELANEGELVVVTCKNPNPAMPGHIAIVRPCTKSDQEILAEGPQVIQAGAENHVSTTVREGFKNHHGAFENHQLLYFAHPIPATEFKSASVKSE